MNGLALQIRHIDGVIVDNSDRSDSRAGEIQQHGGSEPPSAQHEHARVLQPALALEPDLWQPNLPRVPLELYWIEFRPGSNKRSSGHASSVRARAPLPPRAPCRRARSAAPAPASPRASAAAPARAARAHRRLTQKRAK
ncbi:hypothetical protein GCM10011399_34240 [Subtercola lobariae]|uniref:Uncharacterized protein n=1 Tax=Subtercola lobariae TaxID=1588641 RepID=A0A917BGA8_9MICO|nr:hypothetical protein GCM10011399_34240 [Subtercola lobariae]